MVLIPSRELSPILLIDIDHTIYDAFWRDPMIAEGNWDHYHEMGAYDEAFVETVALIKGLHMAGWWIVALTARPEKWRKATMDKMLGDNIAVDELVMRPVDNFMPTEKLKVHLVGELFSDDEISRIQFIIDDHDGVIAAFKTMGIHGLRIHAVTLGEPNA